MTEIEKDQLDDQLAKLTRWEGESTQLWQKAIDAHESQEPASRFWSPTLLHRRIPPIAAVIAIVGGLAVASALILPSVNDGGVRERIGQSTNDHGLGMAESARAFYEPPGPPDSSMTAPPLDLDAALNRGVGGGGVFSGGGGGYSYGDGLVMNSVRPGRPTTVEGDFSLTDVQPIAGVIGDTSSEPTTPADRQVIRKATIELLTNDVRATFLKAAQLPSEARSEYLEASSLTGTGNEMQASLTLRVAADRLSEVLNQLRKLGEVRAEDSHGEDVTSQVVDLDARLRNERRIETELLELLDKRDGAPLKEILQLRSRINEVRQSIERLTAQQQRLSRLVSLATILVIIRAEDAPQPKPVSDLGKYFSENVGASWTSGLRFLSDTIAGLLRVLVGGVIWWVLLTIAILAITRHHRQAHLPIT